MGIARNWLSGDHAKGLVLAVGGILILSPDSLLVRLITADQYSLLFWRGLMTFCTLSLYLLLTHRGQAWTQVARIGYLGWAVALLFALNTSLFVFSIRHTSVANTLLILSLAPLITALFSSLFLGEHAPRRTWVAMSIGLACIVSIFAEKVVTGLVGDIAAVVLAMTMAAILTIMRHQRSNNAIPIVAMSGLLLAAFMYPVALPFSLTGNDWVFMGLLGLVVIPVSFALTLSAPKYLPAPEVGLVFLLETVLGPLLVWLVLDEEPTVGTLVAGGVLIATLTIHGAMGMRSEAGLR
ncbi:MAG: DMT family transporter [Gammaproteobacteria bacterium]|nr:DMT family transporter [Gammaproteobacteria bacterium]